MENERLGLTYDKLTALAIALDVDLSDLFNDSSARTLPAASGRRSTANSGSHHSAVNRVCASAGTGRFDAAPQRDRRITVRS